MSRLFDSSSFTGNISKWNVSSVKDMSGMFWGSPFTGNISKWDVSAVKDMAWMFRESSFNGDISGWDVSSVTTMDSMFHESSFNGDIATWAVGPGTDTDWMFLGSPLDATAGADGTDQSTCPTLPDPASQCVHYFCSRQLKCMVESCEAQSFSTAQCRNIGNWNVSDVGGMKSLFKGLTVLNLDISLDISKWNTFRVNDFESMFERSDFNGDLSRWNTAKVSSMFRMFYGASAFNSEIFRWDVGNVRDFSSMFFNSPFNRWLCGWEQRETASMTAMYAGSCPKTILCECPAGSFNCTSGTGFHTDCPAGYFCEGGTADKVACNNDTVPPGSYCAERTRVGTEYSLCPEGHLCPGGGDDKVPCRRGIFQDKRGQASCTPCAAGGFCNAIDLCGGGFTPCEPGKYNPDQGSSTDEACLSCPLGTSNPSTGANSSSICRPCRPGTFANKRGMAECTRCESGKYQDENGATKCKECESGFCPEGASVPLPCPEGRRSDTNIVMRSEKDCIVCLAGTFCPAGAAVESPCAPGTYNNRTEKESCDKCPGGTFQDEERGRGCKTCIAGSFCPDGASAALVCPAGSFSEATNLTSASECTPCPVGHSCGAGSTAPSACGVGAFTNKNRQAICEPCTAGTFQREAGATGCEPCEPGNYCPEGSSAALPCPAGRRTNDTLAVMTSIYDCAVCSAGSFCPPGSDQETDCSPGTFNDEPEASACIKCDPGSYSEVGATACTACELGKYANNVGQGFCVPCPYPLSSESSGSVSCSVCKDGFFLNDPTADPVEIFTNPDTYCTTCPPKVQCRSNVSLETLPIPAGSWRDGTASSRIYDCFVSESGYSPCRGTSRRSDVDSGGNYCVPGHRGPLCRVCVEPTKFYETYSGRCLECSKSSKLGRFFGVLMGAVALLIFCYVASEKVSAFRKLIHRVSSVAGIVGILPKAKILVSFYQVFNTLGNVYGVRLHRHFTGWLDFVAVFDAPAAEFMLPGTCVGSMQARLALNSLWPVAVVGAVLACISAFGVAQRLNSSDNRRMERWVTRNRAGNATIFILFLVLPNVSRSIFSAKQCVSFEASDSPPTSRSYLLADMDISCTSSEFSRLNAYFWTFFVLWPVLVPLMGLALLLSIQNSVRAQRYSNLAHACRFLWREYETSFLYWEIVDMLRKVLLTALILFVDTESGEVRLLRMWLAAFISVGYLALLALARPFKRAEDLYLSCTSNLLLALCFLSGIAIKLCEDQAWANTCRDFLGLAGSYQANMFVVVITVAMLVLSLGVIVVNTVMTIRTGTIRVAATGRDPVLELPDGCSFHCFLSHAWRTGQDQTHTIARQLQLLLPDIKIWLDVDNLQDVGKLEEAVGDCVVFVIFLSEGYFRSANCRRELYAALAKKKPIVVVREEDRDKGGASVQDLEKECIECCREQSPQVVERAFAQEPIVWVRVRDFQIVSLKLIAFRMLLHLPYYRNNAKELENGLKLAGELGPCVLVSPVVLLVCNENAGAHRVAEEIQSAGREATVGAPSISIQSADRVLDQPPKDDGKAILMLYLNNQTFLDADISVSKLVKNALDRKIPIIPVHEQGAEAGGCAFGEVYDRTPDELLRPPYSLWDTLAIPLYPADEHRKISMRHVLRAMGARPARKLHSSSSQAMHADAAKRSAAEEATRGRTNERLSDQQQLSQTSDWQAPAQLTNAAAVEPVQPYIAGAYHPQRQVLSESPTVLVHQQNSWHWNAHWQGQAAASNIWVPMSYFPSWEGARPGA